MTGDVDDLAWLAALQLADSFFPSGAFTQSYGLEQLAADGLVAGPESLAVVVRAVLRHRLATADLPALLAAHAAARSGAHDEVIAIDHRLSLTKLAREERTASVRVGRRIALEASRLAPGDRVLADFVAAIAGSRTPGNAPIAQGLAGAAHGLTARQTALGACHACTTSLISAAMRLTRLGHGDAQATLRDAQPAMAEAVEAAATIPWRAIRSSAVQLDIAVARHERAEARMFAS